MCFSATASFTLSGTLMGVGAASMARSSSPSHRLLAAAPLLFGAQQAAEGIVWLTVGHPSLATVEHLAIDVFIALALVIWPFWVPLSIQRIEGDAVRRRALTALCWFSAIVSVSAAILVSRWQPTAQIAEHSIRYGYPGTDNAALHLALVLAYVAATIAPFFVSTAKLARTLGVVLSVSVVAAAVIRREALTSVWCFFAAALSVLVFLAVRRDRKSRDAIA
jgi:magnesium-transporting ATPase (P-type)